MQGDGAMVVSTVEETALVLPIHITKRLRLKAGGCEGRRGCSIQNAVSAPDVRAERHLY